MGVVSSLANKSIVVVGGTSGLGLSAAKAFIAAGAKVVVMGKDAAKVDVAKTELGSAALGLAADATQSTAAAAAINVAVKNFGRFDGLYHVAGGSGRKHGDGPAHTITNEGWEYTIEQNLTSLFYSNRAAIQQFLTQESGGAILNMSSVLGFAPSKHYFATHAYAAAKAAVIGFTKSGAAFYAPMGIRINVIAPALVATPMSQRAQGDADVLSFIATKQPLDGGRIGQPGDLDAAAVYFMSDDARFVTGQVLAVDGGWSVSDGQVHVERAPIPPARSMETGSLVNKL
ncbi:MAG TPA: SDR family oxidoreductase, partial [Verrucomicrobiae bacterium]|nr:SDR family oxidoreductase [Verrucomicrobiae bacterium]